MAKSESGPKRELIVKRIGSGEIVRRIDVTGKPDRHVEKAEMGLLRNMDTERFFVDDVVTSGPKAKLEEAHDVVLDYCGFHQNRQRLTCKTASCDGATILVNPGESVDSWRQRYVEFSKIHPNKLLKVDT